MSQYPKFFPLAGVKPQRLAVVCAQWHADLVGQTRDALLDELESLGVAAATVDTFDVPGAFEIPLLAQALARSGRYAAIVACALVVDGGIYRHEFVAHAVIDGLMRAQLDSGVPVLTAVLTPQAFHEHETHARFFAEHLLLKGREAARACVATLRVHGALRETLAA
ncbi:MAG: 6,7-dimethyl-8-ribityllumazine synthase [Ideonella sp.]|nr:MAG: 6,7-dimethyl-8-ribityllumazine synthase [Burkholderiaceae bacterium]MBE7427455.1 6,7-dimethyl-8-ribityllumazine synthase [Ideonella sp.]